MNFKDSGKMKAVTFSYDDGVTQDIHLIEMLSRYGLRCTFNLNSELLGPAAFSSARASALHTTRSGPRM